MCGVSMSKGCAAGGVVFDAPLLMPLILRGHGTRPMLIVCPVDDSPFRARTAACRIAVSTNRVCLEVARFPADDPVREGVDRERRVGETTRRHRDVGEVGDDPAAPAPPPGTAASPDPVPGHGPGQALWCGPF
jgi:hypothetical protein